MQRERLHPAPALAVLPKTSITPASRHWQQVSASPNSRQFAGVAGPMLAQRMIVQRALSAPAFDLAFAIPIDVGQLIKGAGLTMPLQPAFALGLQFNAGLLRQLALEGFGFTQTGDEQTGVQQQLGTGDRRPRFVLTAELGELTQPRLTLLKPALGLAQPARSLILAGLRELLQGFDPL